MNSSVNLYISVWTLLASQVKGGRPIGSVQQNIGLVRVVESHNPEWPVGTIFYYNQAFWRKFSLYSIKSLTTNLNPMERVKVWKKPGEENTILDKLGFDAGVNGLGMTAQTAYYGAVTYGKYGPSDVLVVSGAAGAAGIILGQIAKKVQKVKKIIGVAGGKAKVDYLVNEIGYDAAIDYKEYNTKEKFAARLKEIAGEPITAYFDNTGGFVTDAVFQLLAPHAKIVVCGQISGYHADEASYPNYLAQITYREINIQGLLLAYHDHRNEKEFYPDMSKWLLEGTVKAPIKLVEGFDKLGLAYEMLFKGENIGKVIVKV